MRQRLSSEPDRYRGRRRVPTPPRSRYALVVTAACTLVVLLLLLVVVDDVRVEAQRPPSRGRVRVCKPWPARQRYWRDMDPDGWLRVASLYAAPVRELTGVGV